MNGLPAAEEKGAFDEASLEAIKSPAPPTSDSPDKLTLAEELALTPSRRVEYQHQKEVRRLEAHLDLVRGEREEHKAECKTLRFKEIEYEKLKERYRGDRWRDGGTALSNGCGSWGDGILVQ